jgi:hypothetical protein
LPIDDRTIVGREFGTTQMARQLARIATASMKAARVVGRDAPAKSDFWAGLDFSSLRPVLPGNALPQLPTAL